jgi:hypothetical protein
MKFLVRCVLLSACLCLTACPSPDLTSNWAPL